MSRTLSSFTKSEYHRFRDLLLNEWSVSESEILSIEPQLKPIHRRYLSLACAATVAGYRARRNEYAEGIVEAGYLSLVLAVKGLENPTCVVLRQMIELLLKHLFFLTHPVEYQWASTRVDYRDLTFQFLLDYVRRTDEIRDSDEGSEICERLGYWYGVFSRHVHVHSSRYLGYRSVGANYRTGLNLVHTLDERTKECWPMMVAVLILFHPKRFQKASFLEQRLIKLCLPAKLKRIIP